MLTYVTLDEANGGILRNLTERGIAAQTVAAVRPQQLVRVRFELRRPRLRVEARGEVIWATASGQCGIRFLDLPHRVRLQINEWIFGNLLETVSAHAQDSPLILEMPPARQPEELPENDGLIVSPSPSNVIQLEPHDSILPASVRTVKTSADRTTELEWLSQPLSARSLAWTIDSLVLIAGFLLFAAVFLTVTQELPTWPLSLEAALGAAVFVPSFYCAFFYLMGGASLGARLAQITSAEEEFSPEDDPA
jgi:hypothetical protein